MVVSRLKYDLRCSGVPTIVTCFLDIPQVFHFLDFFRVEVVVEILLLASRNSSFICSLEDIFVFYAIPNTELITML